MVVLISNKAVAHPNLDTTDILRYIPPRTVLLLLLNHVLSAGPLKYLCLSGGPVRLASSWLGPEGLQIGHVTSLGTKFNLNISGWWARATPLKNFFVRQLG